MFRYPLLTVQTNRVCTMFAFIIFEHDILKIYLSETKLMIQSYLIEIFFKFYKMKHRTHLFFLVTLVYLNFFFLNLYFNGGFKGAKWPCYIRICLLNNIL